MLERIKASCPEWYLGVTIAIYGLIGGSVLAFLICAASDVAEWGLVVIGGALLLSLDLWFHMILSGYFYFAAVDKGYTDMFYFRLVFFMMPIGIALVTALPDHGGKETARVYDDELPDL